MGAYSRYYEKKNKITIKQASELMGKSQSFVRIAMQRNLINIGVCVKKQGSKRYDYYINPKLFYEYLEKDIRFFPQFIYNTQNIQERGKGFINYEKGEWNR